MKNGMYAPVTYSMGDAPPTGAEVAAAEAKLQAMKRSLEQWLKYRTRMDSVAAGKQPKVLLKRPGKIRKTPPGLLKAELRAERFPTEQRLAEQLHALLSEIFDSSQLPGADVSKDPNAAVKLARIAISGKLPGEAVAPEEAGFVWLWPAVIVVGLVLFTITTAIKSQADVAKEKERLLCVREGACTDSGFWLKIGSVAVIGWIVWDKMGLRERVSGALKPKRG